MKPIYTADLETDPFKYNRKPRPFCGGVYDGTNFQSSWHTAGGDKCVKALFDIMYELPPGIVFIHNGGKFDMYFLFHWIELGKPLMIINGRIVKCYVKCRNGFHEFRDSYAIMPFALEQYQKDVIDYRLFERKVRDKHKTKIVKYLKSDCVYLWQLCTEFVDRFGLNLTIGGTAMREFKKIHEFECLSKDEDETIRGRFYYGGRVQAFEKGILKPGHVRGMGAGKFHVYDINQSYPNAMKNFRHPISAPYAVGREVTEETFFLTVRGTSMGCFPVRTQDNGINFPVGWGTYHVTIHEYEAAMELGLFELDAIEETLEFPEWAQFDGFVDKFHGMRYEAQQRGDSMGALFYKYIGNSCYGKFAQEPDNYYNYVLASIHNDLSSQGYERSELIEFVDMVLWRIPSADGSRFNVATGASITGAARAVLMRGLYNAKRAVYCDTDSIICEDIGGVVIDSKKIGAWKHEQEGDKLAVAGKKMYALFDGRKCVKIASKGVRITGAQMIQAASGKDVTYYKDAPSYNLEHGTVKFMSRTVRMT